MNLKIRIFEFCSEIVTDVNKSLLESLRRFKVSKKICYYSISEKIINWKFMNDKKENLISLELINICKKIIFIRKLDLEYFFIVLIFIFVENEKDFERKKRCGQFIVFIYNFFVYYLDIFRYHKVNNNNITNLSNDYMILKLSSRFHRTKSIDSILDWCVLNDFHQISEKYKEENIKNMFFEDIKLYQTYKKSKIHNSVEKKNIEQNNVENKIINQISFEKNNIEQINIEDKNIDDNFFEKKSFEIEEINFEKKKIGEINFEEQNSFKNIICKKNILEKNNFEQKMIENKNSKNFSIDKNYKNILLDFILNPLRMKIKNGKLDNMVKMKNILTNEDLEKYKKYILNSNGFFELYKERYGIEKFFKTRNLAFLAYDFRFQKNYADCDL